MVSNCSCHHTCIDQAKRIGDLESELSQERKRREQMEEALKKMLIKQVEVAEGKTVVAAFAEVICIAGEALNSSPHSEHSDWVNK